METSKNIRQLKAEGEADYDYKNDILFFKVKNREYSHSIEFENMVIDIDKENFVTGIQIFDASEFLRINREFLRAIAKWKFQAFMRENGIIEVRIIYETMVRNRLIEKSPIIIQQTGSPLPNSEIECSVG